MKFPADALSNCIDDSLLQNLLLGVVATYIQTKRVTDGSIHSGSCLITVLKHGKRQLFMTTAWRRAFSYSTAWPMFYKRKAEQKASISLLPIDLS